MSGSTTPPSIASNPNLMLYGAMVVSLASMGAFLVAFAVAYFMKDNNNLTLLIGAVIANSTTAVSFWLGSSAGSQRKTELQAPATTQGTPNP
jgi:uncharacterized membrane protein